jgi:Ni,Fe-hydrogenase I small subunit
MRKRAASAALAAVCVAVLGGCSSNGPSPAPSPSPSGFRVLGKVTPAKPGAPLPTVPPKLSPLSYIGHVVYITHQRFVPKILVAGINHPVVFVNCTNTTQTVRFTNYEVPAGSGPIPPGGHWTFHSTYTGSYLYVAASPPPPGQAQLQWVQVQ